MVYRVSNTALFQMTSSDINLLNANVQQQTTAADLRPFVTAKFLV